MSEAAPAQLSERERQVAERYVAGHSYKEIARHLGISPATVRTHANSVYRKLEVTSRIELLHRLQADSVAVSQASAPIGTTSRRLLAIMCADTVAYSAMIERDEAGTIAGLRTARAEVVEPLVERHRGRVAHLTGDGMLGAVRERGRRGAVRRGDPAGHGASATADLAEYRRIVLRIGINLGDVD